MEDADKTKKQLIDELKNLRRRVHDLEESQARRDFSEAELKESEERYRSIVEASPVSIMAIRNGRILFNNPSCCKMLAFSNPQEMVGMSALELVAPEYQVEIDERIKRLEKGMDNPPIEIELCRQDGRRITVESTSVSVPIGGILTAVIIAQDINERIENEKSLQMMRFSIDNALDRIAWIAPDGQFLYANKSACKEMGYTLDEVLSMRVSDIDPNFPLEKWAEHFQEVKKTGFMQLETQQLSGDGQIHDIEVSSNCLKFGDFEFMCSFGRDITERKRLEVKLKESEERFRVFMDNIPASIYIKDRNDRHIYGNPAACKSANKKPDEFIGATTRDLFPPQEADKLIELDQKALDDDIIRITGELRNIETGVVHWYEDIKFPIKLESGEKLLGGVAIDITEMKQKEQDLQKAFSEIEQLKEHLEQENVYLREEVEFKDRHGGIIGESKAVRQMLSRAEQVADTDSTVLILGETGTGKELLARAIHQMSSRHHRAMITVNCAALPASLIESEMFGREKGAFTGALSGRVGRFEIADGSTIFLDEIGELTPDVQMKLLRVLEKGHFERLGSNKTIKVDVRIIAATNRDLVKMVHKGSFRRDLYYRINVFPIRVPTLHDRIEDLDQLIWAFVKEFGDRMGKRVDSIPRKSIEALKRCPWRGNIRELRNVIEQSMIVTKGKMLNIQLPGTQAHVENESMLLKDVERNHIKNILKQTGWRVRGKGGAAEILGLKESTLRSRMKNLGIQRPGNNRVVGHA
jgi:PAS domain S-box-containing protein